MFSQNSRIFVVILKVMFQIVYCKVNHFNSKLVSPVKHYRRVSPSDSVVKYPPVVREM